MSAAVGYEPDQDTLDVKLYFSNDILIYGAERIDNIVVPLLTQAFAEAAKRAGEDADPSSAQELVNTISAELFEQASSPDSNWVLRGYKAIYDHNVGATNHICHIDTAAEGREALSGLSREFLSALAVGFAGNSQFMAHVMQNLQYDFRENPPYKVVQRVPA